MNALRTIIFAKAPQPGLCKTRLIPALGAERAAQLSQRMLDATLASALGASLGPIELCVTPHILSPAWHGVPIPGGVETSLQGEGDLGVRLARAARRALEHDESVILIGTDCVDLNAAVLREAAAVLGRTDAVLNPTADGGYALLALRRFDQRLFSDIAWSTNTVASETARRIEGLGWSVHVGAELHDIDEPADLQRLPVEWWLAPCIGAGDRSNLGKTVLPHGE